MNEETGLAIEVWKGGIDETFRKGSYYPSYSPEMKIAKIATIEHLPELIETAKVQNVNIPNYHDTTSKTEFMYLINEIRIGTQDYVVTIDIKMIPNLGNRFHLHSVNLKKTTGTSLDSSLSGPPLKDNVPVVSMHSITQNGGNINPKNDFQKEISVSKEGEGTDIWLDKPIFDEKTGKWIWWGKK